MIIDIIFNELIELAVKLPFLTPMLFMLLFIMTLDTQFIVLLILVAVNLILNPLIKLLMKGIYNGRRNIPILGLGYRPNDKSQCSLFKHAGKQKQSFGMPSGHSQLIWSIISYCLIYLYHKHKHDEHFYIIYSIRCILLILIGIFTSLSRVYIGCHTISQVLIGGLIGAGTGIGAYYIYPNPPILQG